MLLGAFPIRLTKILPWCSAQLLRQLACMRANFANGAKICTREKQVVSVNGAHTWFQVHLLIYCTMFLVRTQHLIKTAGMFVSKAMSASVEWQRL